MLKESALVLVVERVIRDPLHKYNQIKCNNNFFYKKIVLFIMIIFEVWSVYMLKAH